MIHSFTVAFGAKYLTGMVTSVPPYETFSLIVCLVDFYKSSALKPLGQVNHNFTGRIYERSSYKKKTWLPWAILVSDWLK